MTPIGLAAVVHNFSSRMSIWRRVVARAAITLSVPLLYDCAVNMRVLPHGYLTRQTSFQRTATLLCILLPVSLMHTRLSITRRYAKRLSVGTVIECMDHVLVCFAGRALHFDYTRCLSSESGCPYKNRRRTCYSASHVTTQPVSP